jgi:formiminotetrahydrofolate cyclodeaminase
MGIRKLVELNVREFLLVTAGDDPVPGGGSVSALCGALSVALGQMVAQLTIGKKKYADLEESMKEMAAVFNTYLDEFTKDIDADSEAYDTVFAAFKLPKETDEEKFFRTQKIQEATKIAAEVPLQVAKKAFRAMDFIHIVAKTGNQNAVTDACVAMMCARTAVLGALLNVKINLLSIHDEEFVARMKKEVAVLEKGAMEKEEKLLEWLDL